jgi:hypothetical protein
VNAAEDRLRVKFGRDVRCKTAFPRKAEVCTPERQHTVSNRARSSAVAACALAERYSVMIRVRRFSTIRRWKDWRTTQRHAYSAGSRRAVPVSRVTPSERCSHNTMSKHTKAWVGPVKLCNPLHLSCRQAWYVSSPQMARRCLRVCSPFVDPVEVAFQGLGVSKEVRPRRLTGSHPTP